MVQRCCVPLCETKVGDLDIRGAKVRFHRIPLVPEKILKWKAQITNSGEYVLEPELTINSRVCSKHFLRSDYLTVDNQKTGTAGNHVLTKDAVPSVFKWNDTTGKDCEVSRAIPYVKKSLVSGDPTKNQGVQCSIEEDKLTEEIFRKNMIIQQLLERIAELSSLKDAKRGLPAGNNHETIELAQEAQIADASPNRKRGAENDSMERTQGQEDQTPAKLQVVQQLPLDLSRK